MDGQGGELIFGRFTREECGLPPAGSLVPLRRRRLLRFLCLLIVLVTVGWLGGTLVARLRMHWLARLPGAVMAASPAERPQLLAQGRMYATALPGDDTARILAVAAAVAANDAPRRLGYYGNAANLFTLAGSGGDFGVLLAAAGMYGELGEYKTAFSFLDRANAALEKSGADETARRSLRLPLINAQAYFLATAPADQGRNPEKALHLANLLISSRDALPGGGHASDSAAFMDTLGAAWHAAGEPEKALGVQTLALGLADTADLDVYIRHYDQFASALPNK